MIKLCVLGSGSKGNATYVEFDGYGILIDAGFSFRELKKRLGYLGRYVEDIRDLFISHDHIDHIRAVKQIKKHTDITIYSGLFPKTMNNIKIKSFLLSHDSECYGFDFRYKNFKLTYISDTGCITEDAMKALFDIKGVDTHVVVIECNYDYKMLTSSEYSDELKQRIVMDEGHMDNCETTRILKEVWHENLKLVLPFHLSEGNNNPEMVKYEVKNAVDATTEIVLTEQHIPTKMFYFM